MRISVLRAIISDSVEECDMTDSPFQYAEMGAKVLGPARARYAPDVDLDVRLSPAKSASVYASSLQSLNSSPMTERRV